MSYGNDNEVCFTKSDVTQIIGNNGVGKSSLAVILEEGLYNKNSKGIPKGDLENRFSEDKGYSITIEFSKGDDHYVVEKVVKSSAKVKLFRNSQDISGHTTTQTYSLIQGIIGADFNTFTKLVNQSMSSSLDFLTATDTNRKKFLIDLIGLERYSKMESKVKEQLIEANKSLNELNTKITFLSNDIKQTEVMASKELMEVPECDNYIDAMSEVMADINVLEKEMADIVSVNNQKRARNSRVKQYLDLERLEPNKPDAVKVDTQPIHIEIAELQAAVKEKTQEALKLSNIKTECPTCLRPFDDVPDMSQQITTLRKDAENLQKVLREKQVVLQNANATNMEIDQYAAFISKKTGALRDLDNDIEIRELESIESYSGRISELKDKHNQLKAEHRNLLRQADEAKEHNTRIQVANERIEDLRKQLDGLSTECLAKEVADLTLLKEVFSNKGLVSYKIESSIKVFEKLINEYLSELSKGQFALVFEVNESKLQVKLYDSGTLINIKSVSSGELNKINTSTLLAVRKLMSAVSKVNINLLFIDEVSSVLDGTSRDELTELVLKEHHLNTFMVTHEYTHPLTDKLNIVKEDKISRITHGQ